MTARWPTLDEVAAAMLSAHDTHEAPDARDEARAVDALYRERVGEAQTAALQQEIDDLRRIIHRGKLGADDGPVDLPSVPSPAGDVEGELRDAWDGVELWRGKAQRHRARAEAAEAKAERLGRALEFYADEEAWQLALNDMGGPIARWAPTVAIAALNDDPHPLTTPDTGDTDAA